MFKEIAYFLIIIGASFGDIKWISGVVPILIILGVCYWILQRLADSGQGPTVRVKTAEALWTIPDAPTKLKRNLKLRSRTMSLNEFVFFLELKCMNERVTITLEKMTNLSTFSSSNIYFGIGVKRAVQGENLSGWFEMKVENEGCWESTSARRWTGPLLCNLFQNSETWMPGGFLTFYVRLIMHPIPIHTIPFMDVRSDRYALDTLSKNLKDLYLNDKSHDVTIKVKNETFRAHLLILKARSPVLSAMFSHNMTDSETREIRVDDCDPKAFAVFLLFLYSGAVDVLATDNVIPLYYIAEKYDLPDLKEECSRYMLSTLTIHSVSNVISLAVTRDESVLLEKAIDFFLENAKDIFPTVEWQKFMNDNPTQANELVIKSINLYAKEKK